MKSRNYTRIHSLFAVIALVLGSVYWRKILDGVFWNEGASSFAVFLFAIAIFLFGCSFYCLRSKRIGKETVFFMVVTLVYSMRYVLIEKRDEIDILAFFVIHLTVLLFFVSAGRENVIDNIIPSTAKALFSPFSSFLVLFESFSAFFKGKDNGEEPQKSGVENIGGIVIGIVISVPVLFAVISLLSSDNFFASFIEEAVFEIAIIDIWEYFNPITVLISLYIYGALYSSDKEPVEEVWGRKSFLPAVTANTVMIMLTAVYVIFFIAQAEGYISLLSGDIPPYTTYAQFARSGFFSLCIVACINGVVIYVFNGYSDKNHKWLKRFSYALVVLTLFIILTGAAKMVMYIAEYGFTPKRFYTMWFMLLLTVLFIMAATKIKNSSFPLSRYGVWIAAAMLVLLFLIDYTEISSYLNSVLNVNMGLEI